MLQWTTSYFERGSGSLTFDEIGFAFLQLCTSDAWMATSGGQVERRRGCSLLTAILLCLTLA